MLAIYQSVIFFGHKIVPISDFPDIIRVGHDLLSFQLPSRFKQAPVTGLLQALLSYVAGGQHPNLTGGWLLNAILHPLNIILFYLVGRQIVGKAAVWFALLVMMNHWVLYMVTEPIMETTLQFFLLLSIYLILSRSNWAYAAAATATMVRYEGAALILAAFVMDMIYSKGKKERLRAFAYSALAGLPLMVWLLATVLTWEEGSSHYLNVLFDKKYSEDLAGSVESRTGIMLHLRLLWSVGFDPLFTTAAQAKSYPYAARGDSIELMWLLKFTTFVTALLGVVYGLFKRQWKLLPLLIFFVPYFILHARYPYPLQRFHTTIFWIALLFCIYGLQSLAALARTLWNRMTGKDRIAPVMCVVLQIVIAIISVVWLLSLVRYVPKAFRFSPKSSTLLYLAIALAAAFAAARIYVYGWKKLLRPLSIFALIAMMLISNQFALARLVGTGEREKEFKMLADWYVENIPGQTMGLYMASVVEMYAQKYAEDIVRLPGGETPEEFIAECRRRGIEYVVWATREGLSSDHTGYKTLNLDRNIAYLRQPRDIGPFDFVERVGWRGGYVHVFRLQ